MLLCETIIFPAVSAECDQAADKPITSFPYNTVMYAYKMAAEKPAQKKNLKRFLGWAEKFCGQNPDGGEVPKLNNHAFTEKLLQPFR